MEKTRKTDEFLVSEFRRGNTVVETELMRRYKKRSIGLVDKIYPDYIGHTYAEFDELVNIGMLAVYTALNNYDSTKSKFRVYWEQIATHNILKAIKDSFREAINRKKLSSSKTVFEGENYFISSPITEEENFVREDIHLIFKLNKHLFKKGDKELLLDFMDGYGYVEIAERRHWSYQRVKRRMNIIREVLKDILL